MSDVSNDNPLWYTRREGNISGPFEAAVISRYILLGRINDTDELSTDGRNWQPLSEFPELLPEVMHRIENEEDRRRLLLSRLQEDERANEKRSSDFTYESTSNKTRRVPDRRQYHRRSTEAEEVLRYRTQHAHLDQTLGTAVEPNHALIYFIVAVFAAIILILLFWYQPTERYPTMVDCNAAPAPGVNWSQCRMEGAIIGAAKLNGADLSGASLVGANLRGAQLRNAKLANTNLGTADLSGCDLSGANLSGAILRNTILTDCNLQHANLSGASLHGANMTGVVFANTKLDQAIWTDGHSCPPDALDNCE